MLNDLYRYLVIGDPVEMIYMDSKNSITKRLVKVISIENGRVKAFCYTRQAPRIFKLANILAVGPVRKPRAS